MLGAIIGDIVGSIYEFDNIRTKNFTFFSPNCFFTDDTVMTIAVANALIKCKGNYENLSNQTIKEMQTLGNLYPDAGYGNSFRRWLKEKNPLPYNSYGNGSAMRISPVVYFAKDLDELKSLVYKVTCVSHNHIEGIKGAEATAIAIWLALHNKSKEEIKKYIEENYYSLNFDYKDLQKNYYFNETCQNTVPQAIYCFLISESFEDAIRIGISVGGDSDTLCAITGAIAEAYYGIPKNIEASALTYLDKRLLKNYNKFKKVLNKKRHGLIMRELDNNKDILQYLKNGPLTEPFLPNEYVKEKL